VNYLGLTKGIREINGNIGGANVKNVKQWAISFKIFSSFIFHIIMAV